MLLTDRLEAGNGPETPIVECGHRPAVPVLQNLRANREDRPVACGRSCSQIPMTFPSSGTRCRSSAIGIMLVLAFISSPWLASWRARREGSTPSDPRHGVLGLPLRAGRCPAFYCISTGARTSTASGTSSRTGRAGSSTTAGSSAARVGFFIYRSFRPFPLRPYLDAIAPSLALGIALRPARLLPQRLLLRRRLRPALGRVVPGRTRPPGCTRSGPRPDRPRRRSASLPVHPTQLYSALDGLVLLLLLSAYYPLRRRDGEVMGLLMVTYPITRFLIEYLRNDERRVLRRDDDLAEHQRRLLLAAACSTGPGCGRCPAEPLCDLESSTASDPVGAPQCDCPIARPDRCVHAPYEAPGPGIRSRHRDVVEDSLEDVVGRETLGVGLVADEDPMPQDVAGQALDVVGRHVSRGRRAGRGRGRRGPARSWRAGWRPARAAGPGQAVGGRVAGGPDEVDDVFLDRRGDADRGGQRRGTRATSAGPVERRLVGSAAPSRVGGLGDARAGRASPARRRGRGSRPPASSGTGRAGPRGGGRSPRARSGSGWRGPRRSRAGRSSRRRR